MSVDYGLRMYELFFEFARVAVGLSKYYNMYSGIKSRPTQARRRGANQAIRPRHKQHRLSNPLGFAEKGISLYICQ